MTTETAQRVIDRALAQAGSIPPCLPAGPPPRRIKGRRPYGRRGNFLHYPEERSGQRLFPSDGYSYLCSGRC